MFRLIFFSPQLMGLVFVSILGALAFERRANGQTLRVAVALRCATELLDQSGAAVPAAWWGEPRLATGERAADLFVDGPVFVAVSD